MAYTSLPIIALAILDQVWKDITQCVCFFSHTQSYWVALYDYVDVKCYPPPPLPPPPPHPQDVDEENCRKYPRLYVLGQKNKEFNYFIFFLTLGKGILTSVTIFFVLFGIFFDNVHPGTGFELDYESFQFMIAAALTIVVNIEVCAWVGGEGVLVFGGTVCVYMCWCVCCMQV